MRFFSKGRLAENMRAFLNSVAPMNCDDGVEVRTSFFSNSMQLQGFPLSSISVVEDGIYINDANIYRYLTEVEDIPLPKPITGATTEAELRTLARSAFDCVRAYSQETYDSCQLVNYINAIYGVPECGLENGSFYTCIGLSFFCAGPNCSPEVFASSYIHECVHNALFLEDMVSGVFGEQEVLEDPNSRVISAILKQRRNYDQSFHAAVVAIEMMKYWKAIGSTNRFEELANSTFASVSALRDAFAQQLRAAVLVLTDNGTQVLRDVIQDCNEMGASIRDIY